MVSFILLLGISSAFCMNFDVLKARKDLVRFHGRISSIHRSPTVSRIIASAEKEPRKKQENNKENKKPIESKQSNLRKPDRSNRVHKGYKQYAWLDESVPFRQRLPRAMISPKPTYYFVPLRNCLEDKENELIKMEEYDDGTIPALISWPPRKVGNKWHSIVKIGEWFIEPYENASFEAEMVTQGIYGTSSVPVVFNRLYRPMRPLEFVLTSANGEKMIGGFTARLVVESDGQSFDLACVEGIYPMIFKTNDFDLN